MIDDREDCIVVESMADGLHVYDNWSNVMTNEPPLPLQLEIWRTIRRFRRKSR